MPSPADPAQYVAEFESGTPSMEALAWVQRAFRAHLAGEPLNHAFGFTQYARGLPDAIRHRRIAGSIQTAARLIGPDLTTHSKASLISGELKRLMRVRRPRQPHTWFELYLMQAIDAAGPAGPPTSVPRLWAIIDRGVREAAVQADEN